MVRTYKFFNLALKQSATRCFSYSMSSYPGSLASVDDFFILDSGLFVTETTLDTFHMHLYKRLHPDNCLTSWVRSTVSNRLANSSKTWANIFALYNSGTYNDEWIIVDHNLFTPNKPLPDNTIVIIEQIPGEVEIIDVTDMVRKNGYWASYNIPYSQRFFHELGYDKEEKKHGPEYSWANCSRANIFRRDYKKVVDINSMMSIMRYNDYLHDPLSGGDPGNTIAARFDLDDEDPDIEGAYDAKVTSHMWMKELKCVAISCPTTQQQPVFSWSPKWSNVLHSGQPDVWNFTWVNFDPHV